MQVEMIKDCRNAYDYIKTAHIKYRDAAERDLIRSTKDNDAAFGFYFIFDVCTTDSLSHHFIFPDMLLVYPSCIQK